MKIELSKCNIDRVIEVLNDKIKDSLINVDSTLLKGTKAVNIVFCEVDIPIDDRENGEEDYIQIEFIFEGGKVSKDFYPDREICNIYFDVDNWITFNILDMKTYVDMEISFLQDRLKDYETYMSK